MDQPATKKTKNTGLIVLLVVLLLASGAFVYWLTGRTPSDDQDPKTPTKEGGTPEGGEPIGGRATTGVGSRITPEQVASIIGGTNFTPPDPEGPGTTKEPLYYKDPKALELIQKVAQEMQGNEKMMKHIKDVHDIGKAMMRPNNTDQQECIFELFEKANVFDGVDPTTIPKPYLKFPVYGTMEPQGALYRKDLQTLIDAGWWGMTFTRFRHQGNPWFLPNIGLNVLVGTTVVNTPSKFDVENGYAQYEEVQFFKKFNGHWVHSPYLAIKFVNKYHTHIDVTPGHPDAVSAYCAVEMWKWCKSWVYEIDRTDEVTNWEALQWLQTEEGGNWYFTFINPSTGVDESNNPDNPFASFMSGGDSNSDKSGSNRA